jgi:hypothetical protein
MATLPERLAEAEQAYHDLQMGKAVAEFRDSNGESARYTIASLPRLKAYIEDLKLQISGRRSGPMYLVLR